MDFTSLDEPGRIIYSRHWDVDGPVVEMKIEINDFWRTSTKAQLAILAHENSHAFHFSMDAFPVPDNVLEYENLTDLSAVCLGMGNLMISGVEEVMETDGLKRVTFGYLPRDLLSFSHQQYLHRLDAVRRVDDPEVIADRASYSGVPGDRVELFDPGESDGSWLGVEDIVEESHRPSTKPNVVEISVQGSDVVSPIGDGGVFGRRELRALEPDASDLGKISRKQMILKRDGEDWLVENCGSSYFDVGVKKSIFGGLFRTKKWKKVPSGEEHELLDRTTSIRLRNGTMIELKTP
jgi:hypothetical protein